MQSRLPRRTISEDGFRSMSETGRRQPTGAPTLMADFRFWDEAPFPLLGRTRLGCVGSDGRALVQDNRRTKRASTDYFGHKKLFWHQLAFFRF